MTTEITNSEDIIDSRDIIARIDDLQDTFDTLGNSDEATELRVLKELAKEGEAYCSDWNHGEVIIRESHFKDYAKELAHDIGAVDRDAPWPLTYIDWEAAADALREDYTEINFDGVTYLTR